MNYSEETTKMLQARQRTLTIIWGALSMTLLTITFVSFILNQEAQVNNDKFSPNMIIPMVLLALAATAMSFLIKKLILSDEKIEKIMTEKSDAIEHFQNLQNVPDILITKIKLIPEIERKIIFLTINYFTWTIIRLAINETITLAGLFISITQHNFIYILPFTSFSLMLNILAFPKIPQFAGELMSKYDR